MTLTKIDNLVVPEIFDKYFSEQSIYKNAFVQSGIVQPSADLARLVGMGGTTGNIPFYQDITGDSEIISESADLSVNSISADKEIYARIARGKAWGATDLAMEMSGDDPMRAIGDRVSDFWTRDLSKVLVNELTGLFSNSTMSGLVSDTSAIITASAVVDAKTLLGDNAGKISVMAVHSKTFAVLQKEQLITYLRNAEYNIDFPMYLGMNVVIDDTLPVDVTYGKYTSYLFTPGSVIYGGNVAPVPSETDRDSLGSADYLITRMSYALHPRGTSVDISGISGATPTNAELAGDIWTRKWETKNMGIVKYVHTIV